MRTHQKSGFANQGKPLIFDLGVLGEVVAGVPGEGSYLAFIHVIPAVEIINRYPEFHAPTIQQNLKTMASDRAVDINLQPPDNVREIILLIHLFSILCP